MKKGMFIVAALVALLAFGFGSQDAFAQGSVAGTVIDADGEAVAGAHVSIVGMRGGRGDRPHVDRTETDDDGAFGFDEVPEGDYVITAGAREMGMDRERIEVADGEETEVELQLQGHGGGGGGDDEDMEFGSVSGTVIDADGEPVAEAHVVIVIRQQGDNDRRGRWHRRHVRHVRGETDENGEFTFDEVPVGNGLIMAGKREVGRARERIEVEVDEETEVELQLQGREDRGGDGDGDGDDRRRRRGRGGEDG